MEKNLGIINASFINWNCLLLQINKKKKECVQLRNKLVTMFSLYHYVSIYSFISISCIRSLHITSSTFLYRFFMLNYHAINFCTFFHFCNFPNLVCLEKQLCILGVFLKSNTKNKQETHGSYRSPEYQRLLIRSTAPSDHK